MGEAPVSQQIAGERQKKGSYYIYVRQAIGNSANEQGFFAQLLSGKRLAYAGAHHNMCQ